VRLFATSDENKLRFVCSCAAALFFLQNCLRLASPCLVVRWCHDLHRIRLRSFVTPLEGGRHILTPRHAARFVALVPFQPADDLALGTQATTPARMRPASPRG
jgi:hypothetical protein